MKVVVAGAGIGGLVAALAMDAAGIHDVLVFEAAADLRPVGVGLNILPDAVGELNALGLGDRLAACAVRTGHLAYYNRFGTLIHREPRGRAAGHRWPQLSVHRGRLQEVLLAEVRARLGPGVVHTASRVLGFETLDDGRVRVDLRHRGGACRSEVADLLVGADGIRSTVRAALHPQDPGPQWNGMVVWRGATWARPFLDGHTMIIAGDRRRRAVVYPMSEPTTPGDPVLMNWAVARQFDDGSAPPRPAEWNRAVPAEEFLGDFADLSFDWLDVPALVGSADQTLEYPMVDLDALPFWSSGPVTLLGDAAHAMYPMGSNGATQSIVDGASLARHLSRQTGPHAALRDYDRDRRPTMTRLQAAGRRRGPEVVIDIVDERAPRGFAEAHDVIPADELRRISETYATLTAPTGALTTRQEPT